MSETFLNKPFESLPRQHQAVSFGMWVFLASEILLFSGLFAGYGIYRSLFPEGFLDAGRETDIVYGTLNTAILMTSSLTIAVAGRAARVGLGRTAWWLLIATIALGLSFLTLKGFEYREDLQKHL
ncbi:MAG TPA: cytochrome c oxidase subunit 3, partial [Rhizomicrobium sp.]|nr:cytochrome c oxidase subunit 3 [Rhizomicrobium sp.]